jgi:predicted unusual protein kinase regulating ubiquinone biosynthesis (AarF/ABC1/UbiB family)
MWSPRTIRPLELFIGYKVVPPKVRGKWLLKMLDRSGPTYVKFGQFISNRSDIFGQLSSDLAPLRDRVTAVDFEQFKCLIPDSITEVDSVPIASASIAQIHRAKLGKRNVVLKFKRPNIELEMKEDLRLIRDGVNFLANFGFDFIVKWLNEFEKGLLSELDFIGEVKNLSIFRQIYRDRNDVIVPRPYSKLSTNDLIVMDYIPSKPVQNIGNGERLINMFLEQLIYEGVIHGDLHSGNIGQSGKAIVMYDFGNVIRVSDKYRNGIRKFVFAIQSNDIDKMIDAMIYMGMYIRDRETTKIFMNQYLKYLTTLDLKSFSISDELKEKASKVPVELDATTLVVLKSYSLLEGLCKEIDPNLSYQRIVQSNVEMLLIDLDYVFQSLEDNS